MSEQEHERTPEEELPDELSGRTRPSSAEERAEDANTAKLVARVQAGDSELFGQVYSRYFDRVYAYMKVVLKDIHEAEDATQQVFLQVLEALPDYEQRPGRPFRAWLFICARNYALAHLRKLSRVEVADAETINRAIEKSGAHRDELLSLGWVENADLMFLIERLPPTQRQVLAMRFLLGMPHAEIASTLDLSSGAVRMAHTRAIKFLRERLIAVEARQKKAEATGKPKSTRWPKQSPVIRARRWGLDAPGPNR